MTTVRVQVLVVGGGPVGLTTGMFLAQRGVRVLVVDKRDPTQAPPRAGTSPRTLELFRAAGLGAAVDRAGWLGFGGMRAVFADSGLGAVRRRVGLSDGDAIAGASPVDERRVLTQDLVQRIAAAELRRRGGRFRTGVRLVGLDGGDDSGDSGGGPVRAVLAGGDGADGERSEVVADYLVGADGAGSDVRRLVGVGMGRREVVAHLDTAFFRADLGPALERWRAQMCFVRNDAVYAALISKNGRDRWSAHIMDYPGKPAGAVALDGARAVELIRAAVGDPALPVELFMVNGWQAVIGMASAFRRGRVFLAGDAAHVQSSAGGLGMNTGVQDGHNLAWKLAAVLAGEAGAALLDSYEEERRAAAGASLAFSRAMHRGYQSESDPERMFAARTVDYLRAMMGYGYSSAAVLAEESDDAGAGEPAVLHAEARTGYRLPHHWLGETSTLDLVGDRWTVLAGPDGGHWVPAARAAGAEVGVELRAHRLPGGVGLGLAPGGAALVRPDGFVAWRSGREEAPAGPLARHLRRLLGRDRS